MTDQKNADNKAPEALAALQAAFAGHIRDPDQTPPPAGLEDRRMAIYRDLFFRNLSGLLGRSFPVIRKLYDDTAWERLVRAFMIDHRATTPLFTELPREFLRFIRDRRSAGADDPPFLEELARYEWLEVALGLDETDLDTVSADPVGDPGQETPVVSPLAWLQRFDYPVHRIRPGFTPAVPDPHPHHLMLYRSRDHRVGFMRINPVAARLFQLLRDHPGPSGLEQVRQVAIELGQPDAEKVIHGGLEVLRSFRERDILLGTVPR